MSIGIEITNLQLIDDRYLYIVFTDYVRIYLHDITQYIHICTFCYVIIQIIGYFTTPLFVGSTSIKIKVTFLSIK